ncbi:MAG: tRNA lysidine(34) synthetase TilS [Betaproteobacteria bacterium]
MAASRKPRSAEVLAAARAALAGLDLRGKRLAAGFSGGVDSTVLVHVLQRLAPEFGYRLSAVHVHHGLSRNADAWRRSCAGFCRKLDVSFVSRRVKVVKSGKGLEAAARAARRAVFEALRVDAVAFGHQLDDQAETVLFNLLRGTGLAGASGMPVAGKLGNKRLLRPLLAVPREAILAYARASRLAWIEDESNVDEALTRNFIRRRVGPLLAQRFPRWREALARAARHFSARQVDERALLRAFLATNGLRAPSEARLADMLRQLATGSSRMKLEHDGAVLRNYRGKVCLEEPLAPQGFKPVNWNGASRLELPALGGELRFRKLRGEGIDPVRAASGLTVRLRAPGDRLQPDPNRPRRTLKNLFQESGVPEWQRAGLPLLASGTELVWVPGIGIHAPFRVGAGAVGLVPEWHPRVANVYDR